jgi:predicted secreted protein
MSGKDGFGTKLLRSDMASPTSTFTELAGITNISGPGITREILDVTAHDSPNAYREFLGGVKDPGEISVDVNYDPEEHDVWIDDLDDVNPRNYELEFPDGTVWDIAAFLTNFEPTAPFDNKLTASASFKVTGKPVSSALES